MTEVLAFLWFDTEDFITPESDDIPMKIARIMDRNGVKVVFKLVGEKLRALKKRGRSDVLHALSSHDIGYHSNLHSIHPIMSEYVGNLGWEEGRNEFESRERSGYEEIKSTFGKVTCFGHPGLSWVPQSYPVLGKWDVGVYLDETFTLETMNERPFWYGNILNVMCIRSKVLTLDASGPYNTDGEGLIRIRSTFANLYRKLESENEIGVISVFCHPTTYATKEFWDVLNFSRGKNPPGKEYKTPALKTKAETERDLENLEKFVISAKGLPHLHFVTASDALEIYHDRARDRLFTKEELRELCEKSSYSINFQTLGNGLWVSASEIFSMVLYSLKEFSIAGRLPDSVVCLHPLGPKRESSEIAGTSVELDTKMFLEACVRTYDSLKVNGYLPPSMRVGGSELTASEIFSTCCEVYLSISRDGTPKDTTRVIRGIEFEVGRMVSASGARKDWAYYLSPENFEASEQVKLARLQTWTLKPASPDIERLEIIENKRSYFKGS